MAQPDGSILIDTSIITKNIKPKVQEIEKSLQQIGKDAEKAKEKLELLDKTGVSHSSVEYKEAQAELGKLVDAYRDAVYDIADYEKQVSDTLVFDPSKIDEAKAKLQTLESSGVSHSDKEYEETERELKHLIDTQQRYQDTTSAFIESTGRAYDGFKMLRSETDRYLQTLNGTREAAAAEDEHLNLLRIDVEEYAKSLQELQDQGKFFGDEEYDRVYLAWKNAADAVKAYQTELNKQTEAGQAKEAERAAKEAEKQEAAQRRLEEQAEKALQKENARLQREAESEAKLQAKAAERQVKLEAEAAEEERLAQIRENAVVGNQRIVEVIERRKQLMQEIADLEKAGVTSGYADYDKRQKELAALDQEIKKYRDDIGKTKESYKKLGDMAKQSFEKVSKSAKKAGGLLGAMGTKFKGLALSLLVFNQISKAFRAMSNAIKAGFENLYNEVSSFQSDIDGLKTSLATLKNAFAAAFRPLVEIAIPYIQKVIESLTLLMDKFGQFIAAISGQKTYTKAIEQTTAALQEENKAQNKQLSGLDKLNNLSSENNAGGDAGTGTMFEEVPIDSGILDFLDKMKNFLKPIIDYAKQLKDVFMQGFWDGLGDWEYRWGSIKDSLASIKKSLIDIWTDPAVLSAADGWAKSLVYMLGSLAGSAASIGLTIATNLIGGIAKYIDQNRERIKSHLISMFDIWEDINNLLANLFQSIAYVFEAFASEDGQQLTANILGIFMDMFMGIAEFLSKYVRDKFNMLTQWFVDNKEAFRTALEGFLGVLSEVTGTIKQGVDDTFSYLNQMYDEHIKPFFDSVAQGLSDLTAKFMEFWNTNVQPMLEEWAQKFDTLWKDHLQPSINNIIDAIGRVFDSLKKLWEESIKPLAEWIIDNVLPLLLPIIDEIFNTFLELIDWTISGISDLANIIADIVELVVDLLTGDWSGAWESACDIVVTVWERITGTVYGAFKKITGWIESLLGLFDKADTAGAGLSMLGAGAGMVGKMSVNYTSPVMASLQNVELPAYATGQVIPRTMRQHLAILGDNNRETEIVSPLSTMKQANKESFLEVLSDLGILGRNSNSGGNNVYEFNVDGQVFFRIMEKYVSEYKKQHGGRSPF